MDKGQAVFLDRDGTIIEEVGYIRRIEDLKVLPEAGPAIARLNAAGLKSIVITNQSGVARGYYPESFVDEVHENMQVELARDGAHLDGIYFCPHHPEGVVEPYRGACACRKPGIGLLERAALEHNLDLPSCFLVGDKYIDVETGFRAGARSVLVLTGYGNEQYSNERKTWARQPDYIAEDLSRAVDWILKQAGKLTS